MRQPSIYQHRSSYNRPLLDLYLCINRTQPKSTQSSHHTSSGIMSDPPHAVPARRRSSIAYDPARDTFKELPNTIPEDAIAEADEDPAPAATTYTSSNQAPDDQGRKRRRSISGEREVKDRRDRNGTDHTDSPIPKKRKPSLSPSRRSLNSPRPSSNNVEREKFPPRVPSDLPRIPLKPREEGEVSSASRVPSAYSRRPEPEDRRRNGNYQRRSRSPRGRSPKNAYSRRSPPRQRRRSPSPIRDSPPREMIRPGGARGRGRNVLAEQQRLAAEREAKQAAQSSRGVQEVSNQFYNARPEWVKERGRDWRRNESQIKGLRSFNNWIKSCLIHKFSAEEKQEVEELGWGEEAKNPKSRSPC